MTTHPLQSKWTLWLHKNDAKWAKKDYLNVVSFDNIETFWGIYNNHPNLSVGTFYLMKDDIFPSWEDKKNKNGGRWSFIVRKHKVYQIWEELSMGIVGGYLLDDIGLINGMEVQSNPRHGSGVIKIWINSKVETPRFNCKIPSLDVEKVRFQMNKD